MNPISSVRLAAPALAVALLAAAAAMPAEAAGWRAVAANPGGGLSAHCGLARRGPLGGGMVRSRNLTTDGQGNGQFSSRAAVRGPDGGHAVRTGNTSFHADGSATHEGSLAGANARGSVSSTSSASRDASGNASASRQTTLTSAATGNSANVATSYSRTDSGVSVQRSVTCHDGSGNTIGCR